MTIENKWEYLRDEIEHRGIWRADPDSDLIVGKAPNTKYSWQFYLRRCLFNPTFVFTAAELLVEKLDSTDVQIGACEDAGVPLGLAMATILGQQMISLKKNRKAYGLLNYTEGKLNGRPILLVDDLAGSQNTLKTAVQVLKAFNLPIADQYAVLVNKTKGTHAENYINDKKLISLFNCEDFALYWSDYVKKYNLNPNFGPYC